MDGRAWWAMVHGVTKRAGHNLVSKTTVSWDTAIKIPSQLTCSRHQHPLLQQGDRGPLLVPGRLRRSLRHTHEHKPFGKL